jgi:hypothetical protein
MGMRVRGACAKKTRAENDDGMRERQGQHGDFDEKRTAPISFMVIACALDDDRQLW